MSGSGNYEILKAIRQNDNLKLHQNAGKNFFRTQNARHDHAAALRLAAMLNNNDALEILHNAYGLNTDDARENENFALRITAENGNAEGLRILRYTYNLTPQDARARHNYAFRTAASHGYLAVLEVLYRDFELRTSADARGNNNNNKALRRAAANGHARVLEVLHHVYGLTTTDAKTNCSEALRHAAANGHADVLVVLHHSYGLTREDAEALNNEALRSALAGNHHDVIRMLIEVYGVREDAAVAEEEPEDEDEGEQWRRFLRQKIHEEEIGRITTSPPDDFAIELNEILQKLGTDLRSILEQYREQIDLINRRENFNCLQYVDVETLERYDDGPIPPIGDEKDDLIAFIDGSTLLSDRRPRVMCLHRRQLLRYWIEKVDAFNGLLAPNFEEFRRIRGIPSTEKINVLNFILMQHSYYFLIDNLGPIINSDTNIFILLPTPMKWFDLNAGVGVEHNWGPQAARGTDPTKFGDTVYVVLPLNKKIPRPAAAGTRGDVGVQPI
jgi:hypothetical protein